MGLPKTNHITGTEFLRSDTAATIFSLFALGWRLFCWGAGGYQRRLNKVHVGDTAKPDRHW